MEAIVLSSVRVRVFSRLFLRSWSWLGLGLETTGLGLGLGLEGAGLGLGLGLETLVLTTRLVKSAEDHFQAKRVN